ncbi:hypothetical protein [Streptomyces sp. NBC_01237]|uniref:hypothetical protein n=1 Tax=Streptomyces sp. NBC_01237 TaxID=2903790 RepID=UPI002DD8B34B|nr:hypothetical protein [Streptomyces sp. NBC_01237]WRZ78747.1 hypothetical protein OG251_44790 [Streptomyces sp. NBC_01237]
MPRRILVLGLALYVAWDGILLLVFGLPSKFTATAYLLPPGLIVTYGAQPSRRASRRITLTSWTLTARYLVVGHRPVICGGRRAATRAEWIGRRGRWAPRLTLLTESSVLGPAVERWLGPDTDTAPAGAGSALRLGARPRLYGPDAVVRAHGRKARRTRGIAA